MEFLFYSSEFEKILQQNDYYKSLSEGYPRYTVRSLSIKDFKKGYIKLLSHLTDVGSVNEEDYNRQFKEMQDHAGGYYIIVVEDISVNTIIAGATLAVEKKFIHSCAPRGRIEDVVVLPEYRGKGFAKLIVETLVKLAEKIGCYKLTLDARYQIEKLYTSVGFSKDEKQNIYQIRF